MEALKGALADINHVYGGIKNIIHTAAVVKDGLIRSIDTATYESVLCPKVLGSWNLHVASQELNLALDSFVLFSSTK